MSDEDRRERQIEYILNLQAQLTEKMLQADERADKAEERANKADKRMDRLERVLLMTIRAGRRERREWREHYQALVDAQMRVEEAAERDRQEWRARHVALIDSHNGLVQSQMQTEALTRRNSEDIGRLERMVERIVTGRNGGGGGGEDKV